MEEWMRLRKPETCDPVRSLQMSISWLCHAGLLSLTCRDRVSEGDEGRDKPQLPPRRYPHTQGAPCSSANPTLSKRGGLSDLGRGTMGAEANKSRTNT